jgi:hypothetical protein
VGPFFLVVLFRPVLKAAIRWLRGGGSCHCGCPPTACFGGSQLPRAHHDGSRNPVGPWHEPARQNKPRAPPSTPSVPPAPPPPAPRVCRESSNDLLCSPLLFTSPRKRTARGERSARLRAGRGDAGFDPERSRRRSPQYHNDRRERVQGSPLRPPRCQSDRRERVQDRGGTGFACAGADPLLRKHFQHFSPLGGPWGDWSPHAPKSAAKGSRGGRGGGPGCRRST